MSSPITQASAFDINKVTISQPKVLPGGNGAKMAYLNYGDGGRPLVLQTPSLPSPFGLNVFDGPNGPKYDVNLALRGYQENPKVKALFNALSALDKYMIDYGQKNSKALFKAEMSREIVAHSYSPSVKFGKDKEGNQTPYPPNLKLQLRRKRDSEDFECQFYDGKSKSDPRAAPLKGIPLEEMLPKKVEVTALMQCTGVWFAAGKFGLSWKAVQIRLDSVPQGISGYGFAAEDDDGGQEFSAAGPAFAEPAEFSAPAKKPAAPALVDSEDEDEEETPAPAPVAKAPVPVAADSEDDEEEVAPPPVPKKTVVTKKKVVAGAKPK
jgi:hypothetical protein